MRLPTMVAAWIALSACAPAPPADAVRGAITEGDPDPSSSAVVALRERRAFCPQGHEVETFCSGVLISPRAVLTAAHCLDGRDPAAIEVFFGYDVLLPGVFERAVEAIVHPSYDPESREADLAVLVLSQEARFEPLDPASATLGPDGVGADVTIVGYGLPLPASEPGTRRRGVARVEAIEAGVVRLSPAPSLPCLADSGGAVLLDGTDGPELAAIIRSGDGACAVEAFATALDEHAAFVTDAARSAAASTPPGPVDPGTDFCRRACESTADCPAGMRCLLERDGGRCGYPELRPGLFGEACGSASECDGACASFGSGPDQLCACFVPCRELRSTDSGGCSTAGRRGGTPGGWPILVTLALTLAGLGRPRSKNGRSLKV